MKNTLSILISTLPLLALSQNINNDSLIVKDSTEKLNEVVVTGTMKAIKKSDSPVPIEIYTTNFLKKNPTSSLFDAVQLINGVQPQLNCNVCNTGDIHINGMEGPYTMILIDGMPIVSSLSTVYGLSGIPNSLVERIEVVKGPASSLYGTEAMGGIINVITKSPKSTPKLSLDAFTTSWLETNLDGGYKYNLGEKVNSLFGFNYFKYGNKKDKITTDLRM
ncbi:TonB-dependent receptor plug domain-containing protein [Empedobacter falsenii]